MVVNVHRNLRSPGREQFSIRDRTLKLITDDTYFKLKDVTFVVGATGSRRMKNSGVPNTHAYVRGTLVESDSTTTPDVQDLVEVTYLPLENSSFTRTDTGEEVSYTAELVGYKGKVYAQKETLI